MIGSKAYGVWRKMETAEGREDAEVVKLGDFARVFSL
jgi:hypothetical protein